MIRELSANEAVLLRVALERGLRETYDRVKQKINPMVRAFASLEYQNICAGQLYTWRLDLAEASLQASYHLPPPITLRSDLMPSRSGLYVLPSPIHFVGCGHPIQAIGWCPLDHNDDNNEMTAVWLYRPTDNTEWQGAGPLVAFGCFMIRDGMVFDPSSAHAQDWRVVAGESDMKMAAGTESALRFLLASWLWLKQSIMLSESHVVARHVQKQARRANVDSLVRVVVLRRAQAASSREVVGQDAAREYGCQWIVRGHWRQQFYASTSTHRPIWIEPYVKGPDDMPLRAPTDTVFSVNR